MELVATIAFSFGVIGYSVASTLFFLDLARREGLPLAEVWGPRALWIAALSQGAHVVAGSLLTHVCPVESVHFVMSLAALVAVVGYLWLARRRGLQLLGAFVAPVALTFLVAAQFVGDHGPPPGVSRTLLALHVTSSLLGLGLVLLAGGASAFYLLQERRLKAKRLALGPRRLPALDVLDRAEHRLLLCCFPLLTFGVVTGGLFFGALGEAGSAAFLRALLGYAAWLLVAAVLVLRKVAGWSGRRAAYGTLAGVVCVTLVLAFYALRPVLGGLP